MQGERERIHGHNYRAEVTVTGAQGRGVGEDGYLMDFGDVKKALQAECSLLDERFLCPMNNSALDIRVESDKTLRFFVKASGDEFAMPLSDAVLLPLEQSSAELLARYLCGRLVERLGGVTKLRSLGIGAICVGVVETPHQEARFRLSL